MNAGEGHILYKKFMPFVWGNGGQILDENDNFVFDSPQAREALEFYLKLKKYSYCEKQDLLDDAFKRETLGMTISGSWNFARYPKDAPNLDFSVALLPRPAKNKGFSTSFLGGEILALFKTCKNPDAAARFIRFLTRPENTLPITKEALVSFPAALEGFEDEFFASDSRLNIFLEQMKTAVHPPVHPLWIELEKIINNAVESAMYGENIGKAMIEAKAEYERVRNRKLQNISAKNLNSNPTQNSGSLQITLLMLIAVGTIINAILLGFLVVEVKKNGG
jgi:ABC-type glycerol-3-phosphate transport system substrate-binding protein